MAAMKLHGLLHALAGQVLPSGDTLLVSSSVKAPVAVPGSLRCAGDERGLVGGDKDDRVRYLVGMSDSFQRYSTEASRVLRFELSVDDHR